MSTDRNKTAETSRHRILAADDDPIMREMVAARLGNEIDVICAENGEVAWEKLAKETFDLAIIDLGMPKLDGFGLIRYLRQTPKTVDLPIIVATSRGDKDAIEKAFAAGASGFVTKPINWSLFKFNVKFVLKNGQIERQLRRSETANVLAMRAKDSLLGMLSDALDRQIFSNSQDGLSADMADVVTLARLSSAQPPVSFAQNDVNQIARQAAKSCQDAAVKKSIKLIARRSLANISINVDISIWLDAVRRLIMAGIDSSSPGGTVEIMLGGQRDGSLVISVRDNGSPTSQADIEARLNILIDENQVDAFDASIPDLNLPIVKRSAEIHGGRALFQNKMGEGNVAALWLPASLVQIEQLEQSA